MAKAVSGAIEMAAGAIMVATGVGAAFGASLFIMGAATELAAIASLFNPNPGMPLTLRQPAKPRQIVYGTQRVGAVEIFESTTGSSKDQYNMVMVFATHEIYAFENLYLDGRQVYWHGSGDGYSVRNSYGFGGGADGNDHVGPDGSTYNFANGYSGHEGIFVAWRAGDQSEGDVMGELTANDSRWSADGNGNSPWVGGCAYIYLKCEYDPNVFPNKPDVKATVLGKPLYDPRSGETTYSANWALVINDILTDPTYGVGDQVNQEQLIAAANICDEQIACAAGMESRYTCHYTYSTDQPVGSVLETLLAAAGGRIAFIGGEWYIFPATYIGETASLDSSQLVDKPTWTPQRAFRDKINRVQGTYVAANYPYNAAGNLYDSNGWWNGTIQNNFPFCFAPTNYPTYACDTLHGYSNDQYLTEDGGTILPLNLDLSACLSVSQAQRVAKITLLRNRQQGSGTFTFNGAGYQLQPNDTFSMTFPQRGWSGKLLEVSRVELGVDRDDNGAPCLKTMVSVAETDSSVYEWNASDELTPYDAPAATNYGLYTTAPPTDVVLVSSAATALLQPDGTVVPRIQVTWISPADQRVTAIQAQYQLSGAASWSDGGTASSASNQMFIAPVIAGQMYNVQIRSLRANGAASAWVTINSFTASLVLSVSSEDAIGEDSLVGMAYSDGTAAIECTTFSAYLGGSNVTYFPTPQTITGLAQQTLYWVYVIDPAISGGNLTPVATTSQYQGVGQIGYFLVGSIVTPYASSSGGGGGGGTTTTRFYPTSYSDTGSRTTQNPTAAYDGNLSTYATVSSTATATQLTGPDGPEGPPHYQNTIGACSWTFAATTTTTATTLSVIASTSISDGTALINAVVNNSPTTLLSATGDTAQNTYTLSIASGTDLSTVVVNVNCTAQTDTVPDSETASAQVTEIYIQ